MHTTRIAVAAAIAALLSAACEAPQPQPRSAGGPVAPVVPSPGEATPPRPMAAAYTYTCEDLTTIVITDGQPQARATLNSGMELALARQGGLGTRYGAAPYEFRVGENIWFNQGRPIKCRMK